MKKTKQSYWFKIPEYLPNLLSMDEYLEFVESNLKHIDWEAYRRWKKLSAVNVPFRIE